MPSSSANACSSTYETSLTRCDQRRPRAGQRGASTYSTITTMDEQLIAELRAACPDVVTDPDVLRSYRRDEADLAEHGSPTVVVRPQTTGQVSSVLRAAGRHGVPVVAQGARTGLSGAANAIEGAIVLSLTAMDEILELDAANRIAVVQPGVINAALRRACGSVGLAYPPDPGSWE